MRTKLLCLVTGLCLLAFSGLSSAEELEGCLAIDRVTPFAPRGQVYVEVRAQCRPDHFEGEDPIIAYLELLVGENRALGEDVRVYSDVPEARLTFAFRDLDLVSGDVVLVRLVRFGTILGLQTAKVP